jgi:hypothetical protein
MRSSIASAERVIGTEGFDVVEVDMMCGWILVLCFGGVVFDIPLFWMINFDSSLGNELGILTSFRFCNES